MSVTLASEADRAEAVPRGERWLAAIACLAVAGLHLAVAARFGALGVSRNDDWTYYRVAFASYADGGFSPDPFTSTMLVGLIALARPVMAVFGATMAPLQIMVAVIGALGLWAAWLLVRRFLSPGTAALAVAILALGPLWGTLSTTFMSDVPAFALQALALLCAGVALRRPDVRWGWLTAALALCLAALTIREYAVAATVAVVAVALLRARSRREMLGVLLVGLAWVACALTLLAWRAGLVTGAPSRSVLTPGAEEARILVRTVYTTGLLLSPAVVVLLVRGRAALVRRHWVCAGVAFVVLGVGVIATQGSVLLGNFVTAAGSYPETVSGPLPVAVAPPLWALIVAAAVLSATGLITLTWAALIRVIGSTSLRPGALVERLRAADPALLLSVLFTAAVIVMVLVVGVALHNRIFDRYLMPVTPYAAAAILWAARHRSRRPAVERRNPRWAERSTAAGLVGLAVLSTGLVVGSAALDGAKWRLGERAVAAGFAAETVDASLEWFGLHQPAPIVMQPTTLTEDSFWVTALFTDPHVCAVSTYLPQDATSDPLTDPAVTGEGPVLASEQVWAPLGPGFELGLRRTDVNCSQG